MVHVRPKLSVLTNTVRVKKKKRTGTYASKLKLRSNSPTSTGISQQHTDLHTETTAMNIYAAAREVRLARKTGMQWKLCYHDFCVSEHVALPTQPKHFFKLLNTFAINPLRSRISVGVIQFYYPITVVAKGLEATIRTHIRKDKLK